MLWSLEQLGYTQEIAEIAQVYVRHQVMPADTMGDADHLALASFYNFQVGHPLIFAYLIFGRGWRGKGLFGAVVAAMLIVEGLFTRNPFVVTFPLMLVGLPLAFCIYAPLTYFPLWKVNGELRKHKGPVALLTTVGQAVMGLTTLGTQDGPGAAKRAAEPSVFGRHPANPV